MKTIVQGPGKTYCYCPECNRQITGPRDIIVKILAMHMRYSHPKTPYRSVDLGELPEQDHNMSIGTAKSISLWAKKLESKLKVF